MPVSRFVWLYKHLSDQTDQPGIKKSECPKHSLFLAQWTDLRNYLNYDQTSVKLSQFCIGVLLYPYHS